MNQTDAVRIAGSYVALPSGHPAIGALENVGEKPVGILWGTDRTPSGQRTSQHLFSIAAWNQWLKSQGPLPAHPVAEPVDAVRSVR